MFQPRQSSPHRAFSSSPQYATRSFIPSVDENSVPRWRKCSEGLEFVKILTITACEWKANCEKWHRQQHTGSRPIHQHPRSDACIWNTRTGWILRKGTMFKNNHINQPNLTKVLPVLCLALSTILSSYSKEFVSPGKLISNNKSFPWQLRVATDVPAYQSSIYYSEFACKA